MLKSFLFSLFLFLTAMVSAQVKLDPFDSHCANILILQSKPVQKEVGLTEGQRTQMNVHASWHQQELQKIDADVKAGKVKADDPKTRQRVDALFAGLKDRILSVLNAKQIKRLGQLSLQSVGDAALCDPVVAKKIGMSDAQLKKMQSTYQEGAKKFSDLEKSTARAILMPYEKRKPKDEAEAKQLNAEIQAKMAAASKTVKPKLDGIRSTYTAKMLGVLDAKQKKAYQAILGKTFKG